MMLDWNAYAEQLTATLGEVATASPDILKGYHTIGDAGRKSNKLSAKTRELIALGVAITRQCDGCITMHTEAAIKAGATLEDLVEALGVAVSVNAGAALVYSARTVDRFLTKTEAQSPAHPGIDAMDADSRDSFLADDLPSWTSTTRTGRPKTCGGDSAS